MTHDPMRQADIDLELAPFTPELKPSATALTGPNDQAIRRALEQGGVGFIDPEKGGPGAPLGARPATK
jgi:hypothetical protein